MVKINQWLLCTYIIYYLCISTSANCQTTYYVSNNGNDSNNGLSVNTAFQTINKVNQLILQPGDHILFRRGDTFRGGLIVLRSGLINQPIVIDAYGSGNKPIISGSTIVFDWKAVGNNIWQANCQQCGDNITGIYDNGKALPLGRYPNINSPNKGYLTIQSHNGSSQLTSKETIPVNWSGGEVVIRPVQWILDKATILQQNANTLNIYNNSSYGINDGWGFFIQNHLATLDQNGEWYYNPSNKVISIYSTEANLNEHQITASIVGEGFTTYNQSYVTVQNLNITQTANIGFYAATSNNLTLKNVDITDSGTDGVQINGSGSNVLFENILIKNTNNNAFQIQQYSNVIFRNNTIHNVGLIPGRGKSGDGQYIAFKSYSEQNVLIENNVLDSLGYIGIAVANNNNIVQKNVISNFCLTKSDGGGIYTFNGNKLPMSNLHFIDNIIYNAIGAPEGSIYTTYSGANGIVLDDCSQNIELKGNSVFNCTGLGIFLHATTGVVVQENTSFNNGEGQFVLAHNSGYCLPRNNVVQNNMFISKTAVQSVARYESVYADLVNYGTFDYNYYARPFDNIVTIGAGYKDPNSEVIVNGDISLADWQNLVNQDRNSKNSSIVLKDYIIEAISGIYKINSKFNSNVDGWYPYSYYNNARAVWNNSNGLDGGSLQVDFPSSSGRKGSYVFIYNGIGSVSRSKSYILRFDAIASAENKSIQVFLRQRNGNYIDLTSRYSLLVGSKRQRYEIGFINPIDEEDAIIMMKIAEDGKNLWIDNISLQEATLSAVNKDKYFRFLYNSSSKDSVINLVSVYKDIRNITYRGQVTLAPYKSLLLIKESLLAADLSLSIFANMLVTKVEDIVTTRLSIKNSSTESSGEVTWTLRTPANVDIVNFRGLSYNDKVLSGRIKNLNSLADTTFSFQTRVNVARTYQFAAQISSADLPDPDSDPDSGTDDGEDDTSRFLLRTTPQNNNLYTSPNPNQKKLPGTLSSQPVYDIDKADLSLLMNVNNVNPPVNSTIVYSITIKNMGGANATNVKVQNIIPNGLRFVSGEGWLLNNNVILGDFGSIPAGGSKTLNFFAQVTSFGNLLNKAEITAANPADPDSIVGNGFSKGEDDEAQITIRPR